MSSSSGLTTTARIIFRSFDSWNDFYASMSMYGPQIVLLTCLSAMTIYRRELSCNRGFHDDNSSSEDVEEEFSSSESESDEAQDDDEEEGHGIASSSRKSKDEDDNDAVYSSASLQSIETTEQLLDGAGMYCSGAPLLAMVSIWLSCFEYNYESDDYFVSDCNDNDDGSSSYAVRKKRKNHHHDESSNNIKNSNNDLWMKSSSPADLLDRAGNYCSGEPLIAAAQFLWSESSFHTLVTKLTSDAVRSSALAPSPKTTSSMVDGNDENSHHDMSPNDDTNQLSLHQHHQQEQADQSSLRAFQHLPPDAHVQITSFLHPKDVVTMCSVSRSFRDVVDNKGRGGETSSAIWKTLWYRDYAWIIHSWDVGQQAYQRSNNDRGFPLLSRIQFDKDFYFQFGQVYSDYVLAGNNTRNSCLVSIYSNIYDITSFLDTHPGSPDTLMVHAGKDATTFFEDMGHSLIARRMARSLCVVIDASSASCSADDSACGLHPTAHTNLSLPSRSSSSGGFGIPLTEEGVPIPSVLDSEHALLGRKVQQQQLQQQRRKRRRTGTLTRIRNQYLQDRERNIQIAHERYSSLSFLGQANPYYDPFCQEWKCWYTDANLQAVFTDEF